MVNALLFSDRQLFYCSIWSSLGSSQGVQFQISFAFNAVFREVPFAVKSPSHRGVSCTSRNTPSPAHS